MKYRIDWLLRESSAVVAINVSVLGAALLAGRVGLRLDPTSAAVAAAAVFLALTAFNVASSRLHSDPNRLLYWPGFLLYELIAVAATWATWAAHGDT